MPDSLFDGQRQPAQTRFLALAQAAAEKMPPELLNRLAATLALWLDHFAAASGTPAAYTQRLQHELKAAWRERLQKQNPN